MRKPHVISTANQGYFVTTKTTPILGIIEGFFGRTWSFEARRTYAKFLALNGLNFYIYAPKGDAFLRKTWELDWPANVKNELLELRAIYRNAGVEFGIGLSPHEIYLNPSTDKRTQLARRVRQLNEFSPDILCLLFDDMRGDIPELARIQIDLMHEVASISNAQRIIFCPTYYSVDPVLEKVFGKMPENYWQDLNRHLDKKIDIFWTGEKVCSSDYSKAHLVQVTELLGRKPFLWDNYPVNDGAVKSNFLHLRPVSQSHSLIGEHLSGHALNPMNQPFLSQLAVASLPRAYADRENYQPQKTFVELCEKICGHELTSCILQDIALLQDKGLKQITTNEKNNLLTSYARFPQNPFCTEIVDWLNGGYEFDPACLTE